MRVPVRAMMSVAVVVIAVTITGCTTARSGCDARSCPDPDEIIFDDRAWDIGIPGGSLTIPTALGMSDASTEPVSLNPACAAWDPAELTLLNMLFVAPVDRDPLTGAWSSRLAEHFELRDRGKVFRVRLRDGLRWSDGTPLTVDDLVYSYRTLYADPTSGTLAAAYLDTVGGFEIRRIDDRTYELETGVRHMLIWELVSLPPLPRHRVEPWVEAQWGKVSGALDALNDRWMSHLEGPVCMGQLAIGCALGYLDFRHDAREWRKGRGALDDWYAVFAQRPSMLATTPTD